MNVGESTGRGDLGQAWLAADLRKSAAWRYELADREREEVERALSTSSAANKPLHELTPEDFPLPTFGPRLRAIVGSLERGCGVALVRGLPIENLPEEMARRLSWGIGLHVGVALPQNAAASLIHDVRDRGETSAQTMRGNGTPEEIQFHIDPCDIVALFCRRTAKAGGESRVSSSRAVRDAIAESRPDLLRVLYEPFAFAALGGSGSQPFYKCPVFGGEGSTFSSHFYRARMLKSAELPGVGPLTSEQREAIDLVQDLSANPKFYLSMDFLPGDLQLINNHVVYHARTAYEDHADPDKKRHLFRLWYSVAGSRPLPESFVEAWGTVAGGSLRGGTQNWNGSFDHVSAYQAKLAKIHAIEVK